MLIGEFELAPNKMGNDHRVTIVSFSMIGSFESNIFQFAKEKQVYL